MTLTHDMSLLLLFEQVYRAIAIEKGTGYHH
jgi:23S rRNA pseudoU1915 N3-methylase RlmH